MKKILSIVTLGLLVIACSTTPEGYTINGELTGDVKNGTQVFLKTTDSIRRGLIEVDTATVENGVFTFTGNANSPQLHYLFVDGTRANTAFVLENGTINFKAQKDSLQFAEITGTTQNELFMNYLNGQRELSNMAQSMNEEFKKANATGDTVVIGSLRDEYQELQERGKTMELDYVKENPNALISALILDKIMATKALPEDEIEALYNAFTEEIKNSRPGKRLGEMLAKNKNTKIGARAPMFSGPTPTGEEIALNQVKGKLTLIDFWAGWCRPCRMENPNIVAVYNKYKDKGFNVVGVSLDQKKEVWLDAIEKDSLTWNHVSNLQRFQDPIAQLYNINAIPAAFLLDENGVIVAKDLRGPALEAKVAELLN
ncbi:TlpA disulfide reductase family protein [Croceivirga sp. JEA036]|uniref:TlpA disulfide reductase family protein n=1 Tax=Croceivirga sp. JEA036 TaxID=2721162 RepID=UPI00143C9911|nr:TlpA disulfide reductase family protein [Croceivirga sp. JEA036]NJB35721.1 AhpC/TSA family protein [Croceivirga sp. JEA036]